MPGVCTLLVTCDTDKKHSCSIQSHGSTRPKISFNMKNIKDRRKKSSLVTNCLDICDTGNVCLPVLSPHAKSGATIQKVYLTLMFTLFSIIRKKQTALLLSGGKSEALWLRCHHVARLSVQVASPLRIHMDYTAHTQQKASPFPHNRTVESQC